MTIFHSFIDWVQPVFNFLMFVWSAIPKEVTYPMVVMFGLSVGIVIIKTLTS